MKRVLFLITALALLFLTAYADTIVVGPPDDETVIDTTFDGDFDSTGDTTTVPTTGFSPSSDPEVDSVTISGLDCSGFPEICMYVDVLDINGDPVAGLTADSFCVSQDGSTISSYSVEQLSLDSCVTSVCLVVDVSGSMRDDDKIDSAKSAMHQFVDNMDPFDRVAIVSFANCVNTEIGFTSDQSDLHDAIDSLTANGATACFDGIYRGVELTTTELGSKAVIAFTDGLENRSQSCWPPPDGVRVWWWDYDPYTDDSVLICDLANSAAIPIYTFNLGPIDDTYYNPEALQAFAGGTGGFWSHATSGAEIDSVYNLVKQRLCSRYYICYESLDTVQNGDWHTTEVCYWDGTSCDPCDTASCQELAAPVIVRTPPSLELHDTCQAVAIPIDICGYVTDLDTPGGDLTVQLFYRTEAGSYTSTAMTLTDAGTGDSTFCATVPTSMLSCRSWVDYYISASDGQANVSAPSVNPQVNPYRIDLCEVNPPVANAGDDQTIFQCIVAEICWPAGCTDPDGDLVSCELYSGPAGTTYDGTDICFTPTGTLDYEFVIKAVDSCGAEDYDTCVIHYTLNQAPVADAGPDSTLFLCESQEICWPAGCTDANGNLTSCTLLSGPGTYNGTSICFTPTTTGVYEFIMQALDDCGAVDRDTVYVDVTFNSTPVCTVPSDTTIYQCTADEVCLPYSATDADDNLDVCQISSGQGSLVGGDWCYTPSADQTVVVIIRCEDSCAAYCESQFTVEFDLNDAPTIAFGSDTSIFLCTSEEICLPYTASDSDDWQTPSVSLISGSGTLNTGAATVCFTPASAGVYTFVVEIEDDCAVVDRDTIDVTVEFNAAPVADAGSDQSLSQCTPAEVCWAASCSDVDGNLSVCELISGVGTYDGTDICFTPSGTGSFDFILRATDDCGATGYDTVTIDVTINSDPVVTAQNDTSLFLCEAQEICVSYTPSDPDGLSGLVEAMVSGYGSIDTSANAMCFTPGTSGDYEFVIGVTDPCGESDQDTVLVSVTFGEVAQIACPMGTFSEFLCGPDSIIQTLTISPDSASVSVSNGIYADGAVRFYTDSPGSYNITVIAAVQCGADTCELSFDVTHNAPPVAAAGADQSIFQCAPAQICWPASCSDPDGNLASCDLISGPGSYDGTSICFVPVGSGLYQFVLQATDACGATDEDTVTIDVTLNSAPTVVAQDDFSVFQCTADEICVTYTPSDPDGLTGVTETMIAGYGTHDPANDRICFTPGAAGDYEFIVGVTDPCGETDEDTVVVTVTFGEFAQIACPTGAFNEFICGPDSIIQTLAVTPDSATVTVSEGVYANGALRFYAGTAGTYSITVIAEVECGADTCVVEFDVTHNTAPVASAGSDQSVSQCTPTEICWPASCSDVDGNLTNCELFSGLGTYNGTNVCFTPSGSGSYDFVVKAADACGAADYDTVTIDVTINTAPSVVAQADTSLFLCTPQEVCVSYTPSDPESLSGSTETMISGYGSIDPTNDRMCFTPTTAGMYEFVVQVTDSCGLSDQDTVNVTVTFGEFAQIDCPTSDFDVFLCEATEICQLIDITPASATVSVSHGSFSGGELCFDADTAGTYVITVVADASCGSDTCEVTFNVEIGEEPQISCPGAQSRFICEAGTVCIPVGVMGTGATIAVSPIGSYSGGNLCFPADTTGSYSLRLIATTDCGVDTCDVSVAVTINSNPIAVNPTTPVDTFLCAADQVCYQFSASDVDGGSLAWSRLSGDGTVSSSGQWCVNVTAAGSRTVIAVVTDSCGAADTTTLTYNIDMNDAPIVTLPSDTSIFLCDGSSYCFNYTVTDADDNVTQEQLFGGAGTIDTDNDEVCFTPTADGTYQFIVKATDACGAVDADTIEVTVELGYAVTITCPADTAVFLCGPAQICRPVTIPVDSVVTVSPIGTYSTGQVCFDADTAGHYVLTVGTYSDCGNASCDIVVDVIFNSAPVAVDPGSAVDTFMCDPAQVCYQFDANDVNGGTLTWTRLSGDGTISSSGLWCFDVTATGVKTVIARVTDSCGAWDEVTHTYNITRNSAPVVAMGNDFSVFVCNGDSYCFNYSVSDADANVVLEELVSATGTIDTGSDEICFSPTSAGTYEFIVRATDACGAIDEDTVEVTVDLGLPVTVTCPEPSSVFLCGPDEICRSVTIPVDSNVTVTPIGTYNSGEVCFTADTAGHYVLTVEVLSDCGNASCEIIVDVEMNAPPVAADPTSPVDTFMCNAGDVTYQFEASDPDGGTLVWSKVTGSSGTITPEGLWTFTASGTGIYTIFAIVTDSCGLADTTYLTYNVTNNSAPVVAFARATASMFACEPQEVCVTYSATDVDDNIVTEELLSGFGTIDPVNDEICFMADTNGTYQLIIQVTDACGAFDVDTIDVLVHFNELPIADAGEDQSVFLCAPAPICWVAGCYDPDQNLAGCDLVAPVGSYDGTNICFTPDTSGVYTFILTAVDDCGDTDADTVQVTVDLNSAPVCGLPNDTSYFHCTPTQVSLPISATDVDDNFDHCEIVSGPGSIAGGNWTYTPTTDETVTVVVSCIDDCDAACIDSFQVTFDLNAPPIVDLGNDTTLFFCGSGTVIASVAVSDPDGHDVDVVVESAFGTYNQGTGQVTFSATYGSDKTYALIVSGTDPCGVVDVDTVHIAIDFNQPPTVLAPPDFVAYLDQIGEVCFDVSITDNEDNVLLGSVEVSPLGEYDPGTGQVCFDADSSGTYCIEITARDACDSVGVDTVCVEIQIDECLHVEIEKAHNVLQGHIWPVNIFLTGTGTGKELGGFDFLISYDAGAITPTAVFVGSIVEGCGWEYFTYRFGPDGNCGTACPSGLIRVVGVAETNNGAYHPACYLTGEVGALATIEFLVSNNRSLECQYVPIEFFWIDCSDNSFSSRDGDTMWVARHIYDFELNSIENFSYGLPSKYGPPDYPCMEGGGDGKPRPIRCVDFTNGGIDIICADSIDARGDINLNGLAYEVADAVMFSNYFVYGLGAFGSGMQVEGSIAASDVNADGIALSVADLVYLIRVIVGDSPETFKIQPGADFETEFALAGSVLSIARTSADVGAIHLIIEGDAKPALHEDVKNMQLEYRYDGVNTRVLVYDNEATAYLNEGPVLDLKDAKRIKSIEVGSHDGYMLKAELANLPDSYSLSQNYPNPFNPFTTIEFALPHKAEWHLSIYNILGQTVETFGEESDPGYHKIEWDASRYASGIYFYRLTVGEYSATRKMVLLK